MRALTRVLLTVFVGYSGGASGATHSVHRIVVVLVVLLTVFVGYSGGASGATNGVHRIVAGVAGVQGGWGPFLLSLISHCYQGMFS